MYYNSALLDMSYSEGEAPPLKAKVPLVHCVLAKGGGEPVDALFTEHRLSRMILQTKNSCLDIPPKMRYFIMVCIDGETPTSEAQAYKMIAITRGEHVHCSCLAFQIHSPGCMDAENSISINTIFFFFVFSM